MAEHLHDGHRKRMMRRFTATKLSGFQPHEVLEMLLYYAIPRKDTNPIAHRLLDRFGSVSGVLAATPEALKSVEGVSDGVVTMLAFFRELGVYVTGEQAVGMKMSSAADACDYFEALYKLEHNEVVRAVFLDDRLCLKSSVVISEGHPSASQFLTRRVAELAFAEGSNALILAHNHPNNSSAASAEDIAATQHLSAMLQSCGIQLIDHVIVGRDGATSLRETGGFFGTE